MAKLNKMYYYTSKHEKKVNCYYVTISREIIAQSNIKENDELKISTKDGKIIIEVVK